MGNETSYAFSYLEIYSTLIADSSEGGFIVHSEGNGIFSYHMPGWSPPADPEFDANEYYVSRKTYQAS